MPSGDLGRVPPGNGGENFGELEGLGDERPIAKSNYEHWRAAFDHRRNRRGDGWLDGTRRFNRWNVFGLLLPTRRAGGILGSLYLATFWLAMTH